MVSAADIAFYTGFTVDDADAIRYTEIADQHLRADGGALLTGEIRVEALCYFIASRIANKTESGIASESIGGYSYSRKTSVSSSYWLDLYRELLASTAASAGIGSTGSAGSSGVKRADEHLINLNGGGSGRLMYK